MADARGEADRCFKEGVTLMNAKRRNEAIESFQLAVQSDPSMTKCWALIAKLKQEQRQVPPPPPRVHSADYSSHGRMHIQKLGDSQGYDPRLKGAPNNRSNLRKLHLKKQEEILNKITDLHIAEIQRAAETCPGYAKPPAVPVSETEKRRKRIETISADLNDAFCLFDTDHSGKIQQKFVGTVVRSAGLVPTEQELQRAMVAFRAGGPISAEEPVDFSTVVDIAFQFTNKEEPPEALIAAFKQVFDREGNGYVDPKEIIEAAQNVEQKKFTDEEVYQLMDFCGVKDVNTMPKRRHFDIGDSVLQTMWKEGANMRAGEM